MNEPIIPLSVPHIQGNAWRYVKDCLDTNWVSSAGSYVGRFEAGVARLTGARHAVAGVNGTACLHTALTALGVGPGDGVLMPALTFIATANAAAYCGAVPIFLDCDPVRFNLDIGLLEDFLENRCRRFHGCLLAPGGTRLKAIVPVHILGFPVDMKRLLALARRHNLLVVEDAAESIGSCISGRHTGTYGHAGILSFNGNKIVTCGGGGMVLTSDGKIARAIRHLTQQAKASEAEYIHNRIGFNYRLTNIAAALGLSQIEQLEAFLCKRKRISTWYREQLPQVPIEPIPASITWNRWLLSIQVRTAREKQVLLRALNDAGCQSRPLWVPVPRQKPYHGAFSTPIPSAEHAYDTVINIPSATVLKQGDIRRVTRVLTKARMVRLLA